MIHRSLLSYAADPHLREDLSQNVFLALLSAVVTLPGFELLHAAITLPIMVALSIWTRWRIRHKSNEPEQNL